MAPTTTTGTPLAASSARRSLTIRGCRRQVARARAFVARTLGPDHPGTEVAVLLTSELVTNAILHSDSRDAGGTVTIVVSRLGEWLRIEVSDAGSACSAPIVKKDVCASSGHGLFLVDALAQEWGYSRDDSQTTVWFSLAA
jgi:anti-sigma regulatory factor (Ser/Thr protein kinase)